MKERNRNPEFARTAELLEPPDLPEPPRATAGELTSSDGEDREVLEITAVRVSTPGTVQFGPDEPRADAPRPVGTPPRLLLPLLLLALAAAALLAWAFS